MQLNAHTEKLLFDAKIARFVDGGEIFADQPDANGIVGFVAGNGAKTLKAFDIVAKDVLERRANKVARMLAAQFNDAFC